MSTDKRRRIESSDEVDFVLRDCADGATDMMLFGRDSTGGSICVRVPHERTLYLLPSTADQPMPPPPANVPGFMRCETQTLERAFPQQGASGVRSWQVVTYRSRTAHALQGPPYVQCAYSAAVTEAFLVTRRIKCVRWLTTQGAHLVPQAQKLTYCHAEYTAVDIVESPADAPHPDIVVLFVDSNGTVRVDAIDSNGEYIVLERERENGRSAGEMVALHDPDVVHGNIEHHASSMPAMRYRDRDGHIRRKNADKGDNVWFANCVAKACGCPLSTAVLATAAACQIALLHAMTERSFLPVLPLRGSHPPLDELHGGINLPTVPGIHRTVQYFDFRSLYPSLVLENDIDLCPDMHKPLLPALIRTLVDARRSAPPGSQVAAAFKTCANTLIGCFGSKSGRIYCPSVNERINGLGRTALNRAVATARRQQLGTVIAGQTDSLFLVCAGEPIATAERLLELVNSGYREVRLALSANWACVFMSAKKNRYAALDEQSHLTTKGLLDKTQSDATQAAILSACKQLLVHGTLTFDAATLALPVEQRLQVFTAISELCGMAASMDENDVRRMLGIERRAMQRVSSVSISSLTTFSAAPDHALRPGVAAGDSQPPPVVPIEDLFMHLPLCLAQSADVIADASPTAPTAYTHLQQLYLALRSCGVTHTASRDAIVLQSPSDKHAKRAKTIEGMRTWPTKEFVADVARRSGDERAASCMRSCANNGRCPFKSRTDRARRSTLLAQHGISNAHIEQIEQLVVQGNFEAACGREFAVRRNGRRLDGEKPTHPALYVQQSHFGSGQ